MEKIAIRQHADLLQRALNEQFWDAGDVMYRQRLPFNREENYSYWWHAHVIDALLDGYLRTGDEAMLERAQKVLEGVIAHNKGTLLNNWYDDMEWMALALLRMWDITKDEKVLRRVEFLWTDIQTAWNDHMGGGMAWRKNQLDYKNTPANAPAAILALRLYQRTGKPEDLEWGKRIFEWNRDNLMDKETFYVYDGMNREGDGKIDYDWDFSYCQGVMIGAALEYYEITKEPEHLELAKNIALAEKARVSDPNGGVIPYEGKDDCGLFKGIFVRYLAQLIEACPEETLLTDMLWSNTESMMTRATSELGLVGGDWTKVTPKDETDLAQHLSAMMLIEMADKCLQ